MSEKHAQVWATIPKKKKINRLDLEGLSWVITASRFKMVMEAVPREEKSTSQCTHTCTPLGHSTFLS